MRIREAQPGDARAIAEVHVLAWQQAYADMLPADFLAALRVQDREAAWAESLTRGTPSLRVAEHGSRIVGFSAFGPCRDRGAAPTDHELWALYVLREHWSTGCGRRLWLASRSAMVERHATRISLWVLVGNERATRFYESAGFRAQPESLQAFTLGSTPVTEMRYEMDLVTGASPTPEAD